MPERPWNRALRATLYAQAKNLRNGDFSASRQKVLRRFALRDQPEPEPSPDRWYAMQSVFRPAHSAIATENGQRPPTAAVLSAAGGVGKTCLVATLGRALAGLGEQVLLVDMSAFALLPFYFASREVKPGVVRTFDSPGQSNAPVRLLSLDAREPEPLLAELVHSVHGVSRVLVDVGIAHRGLPGRLLSLGPTMLVPILPDMNALAFLASLETLAGGASQIFYLLNQFDASLPLHVDVRAMLQQQLGTRLLSMVLHRSPAVSEALAEGTTVLDYAPRSQVAEDYRQLAAWLRNLAAPALASNGGMRWTER